MAEQRVHGATIRTSGPPPKQRAGKPQPRTEYYEIVMSHCDGNLAYKVGTPEKPNYRGMTSQSRAEELVRKGILRAVLPEDMQDAVGDRDIPVGAKMVNTDDAPDLMTDALTKARASTWKPGTPIPKAKRSRPPVRKAADPVDEEDEE